MHLNRFDVWEFASSLTAPPFYAGEYGTTEDMSVFLS